MRPRVDLHFVKSLVRLFFLPLLLLSAPFPTNPQCLAAAPMKSANMNLADRVVFSPRRVSDDETLFSHVTFVV